MLEPTKQEELKWIDGIFLTKPPIINAIPSLGRVIVQQPTEDEIKKKKGSKLITLGKEAYAIGDEYYGRIVAAHPDEKDYKIGDYVAIAAQGTIVRFSGIIMESCPVHSILAKITKEC